MIYFLIPGGLLLYVGIQMLYSRRMQRQLDTENELREKFDLPPLTTRQFKRKFIDTRKFRKGVNLHS